MELSPSHAPAIGVLVRQQANEEQSWFSSLDDPCVLFTAVRERFAAVSILVPLAALILAGCPGGVNAASVIQVVNSSATAGGTGSFDVDFTNNTGATLDVSNFSVQLSVPGGGGITLTGANVSTRTAAYVFTTLQTPPLTFVTFPTTSFIASDSYASLPGWVVLAAGETVGLEHVTYSVAGGTPVGPVTVSINAPGTHTEILDQNSNPINVTLTNGSITVGAVSVPATSSLLMGLTAAALLLAVRRLSRTILNPIDGPLCDRPHNWSDATTHGPISESRFTALPTSTGGSSQRTFGMIWGTYDATRSERKLSTWSSFSAISRLDEA
jgi:hypothetical protein